MSFYEKHPTLTKIGVGIATIGALGIFTPSAEGAERHRHRYQREAPRVWEYYRGARGNLCMPPHLYNPAWENWREHARHSWGDCQRPYRLEDRLWREYQHPPRFYPHPPRRGHHLYFEFRF